MPEYNKKIKAYFGLSPAVYWSDIRSPMKYFVPVADNLEFMYYLFGGSQEFAPQSWLVRLLSLAICQNPVTVEKVCYNIQFIFFGYDRKNLNTVSTNALLSRSELKQVSVIDSATCHSKPFSRGNVVEDNYSFRARN